MTWIIPSDVVKGGNVLVAPMVAEDTSFAALAAGIAYTSITFDSRFKPFFDISVIMDQAGSLQFQGRFQSVGPGSTWRNLGAPYIIQAFNPPAVPGFVIQGLRLPSFRVRLILTNTAAVDCIFTELIIHNRSL